MKRRAGWFLTLAVAFVIFLSAANYVFAAYAKALAPPKMPDEPQVCEINDDASFAKCTKSYRMMPYNKEGLEFEIFLPLNWNQDSVLGEGSIVGPAARYKSPNVGGQQAIVEVLVWKVEYQASARNWLKDHLISSGYSLQGEVTETSEKSASASFIDPKNVNSDYYITVRISGSFAVTALFRRPLSLKAQLSDLEIKSLNSFTLLHPDSNSIEEEKVFSLADSVRIHYPASWKVSNKEMDVPDHHVVEIRNFKPGTTGSDAITRGYMRIAAIRRQSVTNLEAETEAMRKYFADVLNVELKKMLSTGKSDAGERFVFNRYEVYDSVSKAKILTTAEEVHLVTLGDKEWYIFAFLLTPKERDDFGLWDRNVQSFHEVIKSIK